MICYAITRNKLEMKKQRLKNLKMYPQWIASYILYGRDQKWKRRYKDGKRAHEEVFNVISL